MRIKRLPVALILAGMTVPVQSASADLVTGFEPPAYQTGFIAGQQGWTDNSATSGSSIFQVSTANPQSGLQAVTSPDAGNRYRNELISPNTATASATAVTTVAFGVDIAGVTPTPIVPGSPPSGSAHEIDVVSNASTDIDPKYGLNDFVGGINFQPDGSILVEEYSPDFGGFMSLTTTAAVWTPNVYHTVAISVNPATDDLTYTYDGTLLADTTAFYEQAVGNVAVLQDDVNNPAESFSLDNLSVTVPEPTTLGLSALSAVALVGRRRRIKVSSAV